MVKYKNLVIASSFFAIIFALISLVNHYCFRTYALDLGLYTNAAYKYAHFQLGDNNMIKDYYEPILGGHFDLYLILFSPLIYILGSYSLLIVQIVALVMGGVGVYRYFDREGITTKYAAIIAALYFYLFYGVYGAVSYDYHSIVVASSLIPWFLLYIREDKFFLSSILVSLILVSQENVSFWLFFICIALMFKYRKDRHKLRVLSTYAIFSLIYFITILYYVIPMFSHIDQYGGFLYSSIGNNATEAFKNIIADPVKSFQVLFSNHNNSPQADYVKTELWIMLLASGLPFLLLRPYYLIMLIPILGQKLFHDNPLIWGIGGQYNIEFAPIFAIGIMEGLTGLKSKKRRKGLAYFILVLIAISSFHTMDNTVSFTDKARMRFYQKQHYIQSFDIKKAYKLLSLIPEDAAISAQTSFVPHLALREKIYQFPILKDAEYIFLYPESYTYPLSPEEMEQKWQELKSSKDWEILEDSDFKILRKKASSN